MKITTWQTVTEVELDETTYNVSLINVADLVSAFRNPATVDLAASATSARAGQIAQNLIFSAMTAAAKLGNLLRLTASGDEPREATGEDILAAFEAVGGQGIFERDPDTGLITTIHASASLNVYEYDSGEMSEVLESLQAAGLTPSKIVGDLAQTSVGATGAQQQVIGLAEWTIDWKRKTVDATTTDNLTYESSLPSMASWSVKAKYMFIDGDPGQATNILATIGTPQTPVTWNFFPTIAAGRSAFSGQAYVDGITIASGMGKVVGLDCSLKGTGQLFVDTQLAPTVTTNTGTGEQAED